jgi:hypothetical protein
MLPKLLRTLRAAATTALRSPVAPKPSRVTPTAPAWRHAPSEPQSQAEKCGQCSKPLTQDSPTLDFCSDVCRGTFARSLSRPIPNASPIRVQPVRPAQPAIDPPWLAAITDWDRKRAQRLIADRKSPTGEGKAAA